MNNCKFTWLIPLLCLLVFPAGGTEWKPCHNFLKAVRFVESSNGKFLVGDNGQSLGDFQISEAAWLDVNEWRKARGLKIYSYDHVFNTYLNRTYASNYLSLLHRELSRKLKRSPTHAELYAAYNMGLASFSQVDYQLKRVNSITRAKCEQINSILGFN
jgi:hypothetical protein